MSEDVIVVRNITKKYGDFTAVDSLSFEVKKGEVFGLLGPNGAGKTTTLEIIETLKSCDSGNVEVLGYPIHTHAREIRSRIGIQLQSSDYYPNLTLAEVLELFGALYATPVNPSDILRAVNLENKAKAQFKTLSGGQKQRFSIATTLINTPDIIFLDEPTTGLDPSARRNLWELIRHIRSKGTTIVLTTHYMEEAQELADRVAIMDSGRIVCLDTPHNLINQLLSRGFVQNRTVQPATLEDVFIDLTGKTLPDLIQ